MIIRTGKRIRLWICLLVVNLLFIWGNSMLPGEVSGAISGSIKDVIHMLIPGRGENPEAGHGLLRKFGHFLEFGCLGMCLSVLVRMWKEKPWQQLVLPLVFGAAVACMDETIQIFVPDRGPGIRDVGIDTLGVATGILFLTVILTWRRRRK